MNLEKLPVTDPVPNGLVLRSGKQTEKEVLVREEHKCAPPRTASVDWFKPSVPTLPIGSVWYCTACHKRWIVSMTAGYLVWKRRHWPWPRHKHNRVKVTDYGTLRCTLCGKYRGNAYDTGPG